MPDAHHIETEIRAAAFEPLGWLGAGGSEPFDGGTLLLVGNAGPAMFTRFTAERDPAHDTMDEWTREVLSPLAASLGARAVFPFDQPHPPFLRWAQLAGAGHVSPLGLNIRADFGLWHAFRAAFMFDEEIAVPAPATQVSPCETCVAKPCLSACPVNAFSGNAYDVATCAAHLAAAAGAPCRETTCLARLACPVAPGYRYNPDQMRFHMAAFMQARGVDPASIQ